MNLPKNLSGTSYPEPFNTADTRFVPGDKVIDRQGNTGVVLGPKDWADYEYNYPGKKWELVRWDRNIIDQHSGSRHRTWVGNIWIKKL